MTALSPVDPSVPASNFTAWWRIPIVWLVVGLPAAAVVAATASGIIAARGADPVVDEYKSSLSHAAEESLVNGSAHGELEPAEAARNHAATPKH